MTEKEKEESKKISVTIRGIDKDLYERISAKARELNTTVGELINDAIGEILITLDLGLDKASKITDRTLKTVGEAIKLPIASVKETILSKDYIIISNIGELTLSEKDLKLLDKPLILVNVKKVRFEKDVTAELLSEKIKSIKLSEEVLIPSNIPKVIIAQKSQFVKKISNYD